MLNASEIQEINNQSFVFVTQEKSELPLLVFNNGVVYDLSKVVKNGYILGGTGTECLTFDNDWCEIIIYPKEDLYSEVVRSKWSGQKIVQVTDRRKTAYPKLVSFSTSHKHIQVKDLVPSLKAE